MAKTWPAKDPQDIADYGFDWSGLTSMGDAPSTNAVVSVSASVVSPVTGAVTVLSSAVAAVQDTPTGQGTVHRLSGGTAGTESLINLHIVTQSGEEFDQAVKIKVKER